MTNFFFNNKEQLPLLKFEIEGDLSESEIRRFVKRKHRLESNDGLIKIIRKLSPEFCNLERDNYLQIPLNPKENAHRFIWFNVDICGWFQIVSKVRHSIVHNRQTISQAFRDFIEKNESNKYDLLFKHHFNTKKINGNECFFVNENQAADVITWFNSFAHFIFKSLSIDHNLSPEVELYTSGYYRR